MNKIVELESILMDSPLSEELLDEFEGAKAQMSAEDRQAVSLEFEQACRDENFGRIDAEAHAAQLMLMFACERWPYDNQLPEMPIAS